MPERSKLHDDSIMPFGKYKGEKLRKVPLWYWQWLCKQPWAQEQHKDLIIYAEYGVDDE